MAADLGSLYKILKDPTRRRILSALNERGSLAYVEILGLLEIEHTGKLNYHLKQLGDLISKDNEGRYGLTEKGKLAVQVLSQFQPAPVQENIATLRIDRVGVGKILLVLSIPSFLLSLIPLSSDFWTASDLSMLLGVITLILLIFGITFVLPRNRFTSNLSLRQGLMYGTLELSLMVLLLIAPISGLAGGMMLSSQWSSGLLYVVILPGLLTWSAMALRHGEHSLEDVLKMALGATALLWVGGVGLSGMIVSAMQAAPGFSAVYQLVFTASLMLTFFLFAGVFASEGAYRLAGWRGRDNR